MLDDLRKSTSDDDDLFSDLQETDEDIIDTDDEIEPRAESQFLGMTAVERMFLSIFLFMNVLVLGLALLLATGRMRF